MRNYFALLSALVERWRSKTHTFHLLVGEVTMTLENMTHILGLPINGEPVISRTDSSHQFFVENCFTCFGREPGPHDHVLGKVNLVWVRRCRDTKPVTRRSPLRGMVVFLDKYTTSLKSKFFPLLRDFHRISLYSWGQPVCTSI
ncbi:hypothetical protein AHAS_Ahas13G0148900 [Arachis hypogaea]